MALQSFLQQSGFYEADLLGQWPRFEYPTRYCMYDASENALVQAFPADRPGSWFVAALNYFRSTLEYGANPRPADGVVDVMRKFCFEGLRVWCKSSGEFFTAHPWCKAKSWGASYGDPLNQRNDDVGVPGTMQFLTIYPFCEPSSLNGNESPIGSSIIVPKLFIAPAAKVANEYDEETLHSRRIDI